MNPALVATSAASAERLPLRQSNKITSVLLAFFSNSLMKRGLRVKAVPVAQGMCSTFGTRPTNVSSSLVLISIYNAFWL